MIGLGLFWGWEGLDKILEIGRSGPHSAPPSATPDSCVMVPHSILVPTHADDEAVVMNGPPAPPMTIMPS